MASPLRVVKAGGSLLELPELPRRLECWLSAQAAAHHVLITGGGSLVNEVRRWNAQSPLNEETAHWVSIDLMSVTARLLQSRLPTVPLTDDQTVLRRRLDLPGATFFDVSSWLRADEPHFPGRALPISWEVTSDAIAGRLAICLQASELVLLKSRLPDEDTGNLITDLASSGLVDRAMSLLAAELPRVRIVNMRANPPAETVIRTLELHL